MVSRLITFPLRVTVRGAQLWFRAAEEVAGRATSGALRVAGAFTGNGSSGSGRGSAVDERPRPEAERRESARARDPRSQASAPAEPAPAQADPSERATQVIEAMPEVPAPAAPEPAHVSEEPELVREEAEPGAEEGAGARVTVHEPWDGYARMSAKEVIARLADATSAELAAVALYESGNRSRQTVLEAVQRHMRAADGGGSPD